MALCTWLHISNLHCRLLLLSLLHPVNLHWHFFSLVVFTVPSVIVTCTALDSTSTQNFKTWCTNANKFILFISSLVLLWIDTSGVSCGSLYLTVQLQSSDELFLLCASLSSQWHCCCKPGFPSGPIKYLCHLIILVPFMCAEPLSFYLLWLYMTMQK